jgi:hypothetical protein
LALNHDGVALTYSRGAFITVALLVLFLAVVADTSNRAASRGPRSSWFRDCRARRHRRAQSCGIDWRCRTLGKQDAKVAPDGAIKGRATEMLAALAVYLDHPFIGVGPGQYVPFYSEKVSVARRTELPGICRARAKRTTCISPSVRRPVLPACSSSS